MAADDKTDRIITLRDRDRLKWKEIEVELGIPWETARTRYKRWKSDQIGDNDPLVNSPLIDGVFPDDYDPTDDEIEKLWETVISNQSRWFGLVKRRKLAQRITLPVPSLLAFLSDLHFGDPGTDYEAAKQNAELIRDTDNAFCGHHGDGVNNWLIAKLAHLQRDEVVSYDGEWQLFFSWLNILRGKLLYVVAGNHDNWTRKVAGIDRVRDALHGAKILYHPHEVRFSLTAGPKTYKFKVRHKWRGSSIYNVTHGIEVGWERGGYDFDFGIGGHTHQGTYCRPFTRHNRKLYAVLTGAYKLIDEHGEELGLQETQDRGCGAFVFDNEGIPHWEENLRSAADYLAYLRSKVK